MRAYENGQYRDLTAEEIAAIEAEAAKFEAYERTRPLTAEEVTAMLIRQQINGLTVDDNTALRMREFYPEWAAGCGAAYRPTPARPAGSRKTPRHCGQKSVKPTRER